MFEHSACEGCDANCSSLLIPDSAARVGARPFRILAEHRRAARLAGGRTLLSLDQLFESLERTLRLTLGEPADEHATGDGAERTAWRSEFVGVVEHGCVLTAGPQLVHDRCP